MHLSVMLYIRSSLPRRNIEDLLHERGIEIRHKTVRHWW
jgi:putative transposase